MVYVTRVQVLTVLWAKDTRAKGRVPPLNLVGRLITKTNFRVRLKSNECNNLGIRLRPVRLGYWLWTCVRYISCSPIKLLMLHSKWFNESCWRTCAACWGAGVLRVSRPIRFRQNSRSRVFGKIAWVTYTARSPGRGESHRCDPPGGGPRKWPKKRHLVLYKLAGFCDSAKIAWRRFFDKFGQKWPILGPPQNTQNCQFWSFWPDTGRPANLPNRSSTLLNGNVWW